MHGVRLLFCIRASGYQGILFEPGEAFSPKGYFSRHPGQITSQRYTHDIYHGLVNYCMCVGSCVDRSWSWSCHTCSWNTSTYINLIKGLTSLYSSCLKHWKAESTCTYGHSQKLNPCQFLLNNLLRCIHSRSVCIQKVEFFEPYS